jgi:hypothetical protein
MIPVQRTRNKNQAREQIIFAQVPTCFLAIYFRQKSEAAGIQTVYASCLKA